MRDDNPGSLRRILRVAIDIATGLLMLPVLILALVTAPNAWLRGRPTRRSDDEVAGILGAVLAGSLSRKAWRRFADRPIADSRLDAIRQRARLHGPPDMDRLLLRKLIADARSAKSRR